MAVNDSSKSFSVENNIIKGCKQTWHVKEKSIGELVLNILKDNLDCVGQIEAETGNQTTFAEMRENSIRCALWMQKEGIKSGDVVTVCTYNQMDTYIPYLATFYIGATQNPWFYDVNLKSAQYFMQLTKPKLIFASESCIDTLIKAAELENIVVKFIVFGKHHKADSLRDIMKIQLKEEVINFQIPKINPKDIALILFSSGTTGNPKAVQHSFQGIFENLKGSANGSIKNKVYLWYSTLFWISGASLQFQSILTVSTRIIHKDFDAEETCKYIEKYQVNYTLFTSLMLTYFSKSNILSKYDFSSLKMVTTGGSRVSCEILEEFKRLTNIPITQVFGMTELFAACTMQSDDCISIESVGFVLPNFELKVIDLKNHEILGPNQPGELCIKAPWKMVGYLNNEAATKEIIDEEDWLHTGDIVYYDENIEFFITDRIKEVLKVAGHHVSPSEIEEILINHPAVMEVVVVPVPHKLYTETPVALVKKNPEIEVTEEELIKLSSELGKYKTLSHVQFMDELPHTPSSKMNRKMAKEIAKVFNE